MNSSEIKRCDVCYVSLTNQAVFIAECSHSFHLSCISYPFATTSLCPICHTKWNHVFHNNSYNAPFQNCPYKVPLYPTSTFPEQEPLQFSDDDPLLPHHSYSVSGLPKLTLEAIPERPVVASSEFVSLFTVLLKLKAPPLSSNARSSQRAPLDLVTVLDVSGSMYGKKLSLLKQAVNFVIDNLGPCDRLSIVSFSNQARRIFRLSRMTETGRQDAKLAVSSLSTEGGTNIVEGLKKGSQVLEERRYKNPVASIVFLSDGNDTCNGVWCPRPTTPPGYLRLLPPSIFPINENGGLQQEEKRVETIPVHSFGFGSDHDPVTMHAISYASGGTFSFIESYAMVQDAFASCIGGLLSVVTQGLRILLRSASLGVEIKSIPSGRYSSKITDHGSVGHISIGDLYADEVKEFLINLAVPAVLNSENKTSLLDMVCSYIDVVSKEAMEIGSELAEIQRVKTVSPLDMAVNLEVDRQRNWLRAAESIAEAQKKAEMGDLLGARGVLSKGRTDIFSSDAGKAGDSMCAWLGADMKETERRMGGASSILTRVELMRCRG